MPHPQHCRRYGLGMLIAKAGLYGKRFGFFVLFLGFEALV